MLATDESIFMKEWHADQSGRLQGGTESDTRATPLDASYRAERHTYPLGELGDGPAALETAAPYGGGEHGHGFL